MTDKQRAGVSALTADALVKQRRSHHPTGNFIGGKEYEHEGYCKALKTKAESDCSCTLVGTEAGNPHVHEWGPVKAGPPDGDPGRWCEGCAEFRVEAKSD